MSDTLASFAVELGFDISDFKRGANAAYSIGKAAGERAGSAFAEGFRSPLLNAVAGVGDLLQGARETVSVLANVSGMGMAAEFERVRRQLSFISGDARTANKALLEMQKIAGETNFNANQVTSVGVRMAGRTGDVSGAVSDVGKLVDAAAVGGVTNGDFNAFQSNFSDIQNKDDRKVDVEDFKQLMSYAPSLTTAMAKALGTSNAAAYQKISTSTGKELSALILAVGEKNKGAAAAASNDPFAIAANIQDTFATAMAPTGELLNRALVPILHQGLGVVQAFQSLNQASGGSTGLVAMFTVGAFAIKRLGQGVTDLTSSARGAAEALKELDVKARSTSTGGGGVVGAAGTSAKWGVAGIAGSIGLEALADNLHKSKSENAQAWGDVAQGAGEGLAAGAPFGPLGMAIAGIGGIVKGTAVAAWRKSGGMEWQEKKDAAERTAKATEDAAKSLRDMKTTMVGGGERAAGSLRGLEYEYAMQRLRVSTRSGFA